MNMPTMSCLQPLCKELAPQVLSTDACQHNAAAMKPLTLTVATAVCTTAVCVCTILYSSNIAHYITLCMLDLQPYLGKLHDCVS